MHDTAGALRVSVTQETLLRPISRVPEQRLGARPRTINRRLPGIDQHRSGALPCPETFWAQMPAA